MSRRRFVYIETAPGKVESFEVGRDWLPSNRSEGRKSEEETFGHLMATDGTNLSTRRRHREYMKANGLALADDYRDSWQKAAQQRAEYFTHGPNAKSVRESIERAMHQLTNKRKP